MEFNFDPITRQSKCVLVKAKALKLGGNVSQNCSFVRFFPLLVGKKIKSTSDGMEGNALASSNH